MRLLASTDIALRVLILLAGAPPGRPVSVGWMARELGGLSRDHLHKIVQELTSLGITRTVRGAGGGMLLARAPAEVRLGSLVRHLEADQAMVECFRAEGCACTLLPGCRLRGMLASAEAGFYASLDGYTLADCSPDPERDAPLPDRRLAPRDSPASG
ncbi:MAG TPA: Rrf2 family transcriptional regulator [Acetobacteraceae bacterium]|nr:Rrf2 family transcriptional regulator [Acetobacteraceae bacterium]